MTRAPRLRRAARLALPLAAASRSGRRGRRCVRRSAHAAADASRDRRRGRPDRVAATCRSAILQSLGRVFGGFAVAALLAVPLGLAMGTSRAIERNLDPLVESFRPIAAIAILPLAILWLGTGTAAAVLIVAYAAFFPIVINTVAGVKRVDPTLLRAAAHDGPRPR